MQLSIHGKSVNLTDSFREYITRRLHFALGRFAPGIASRLGQGRGRQWCSRRNRQEMQRGGPFAFPAG